LREFAPASSPTGTRADAQRDRILCAALKCFIEHGFHAASMASIAEAAQMSAGLIYRYFENKNAIVLAIVQRQLEEKRVLIRELQSSKFVDGLLEAFEEWCATPHDSMSIALMLEMTAEATRNPQIAEALKASDRVIREEVEEWLRRPREQGGGGLSPERVSSRSLALRFVVDGLALRAAREPGLDRVELRATLGEVVETLLEK
jgi:TetR/AcrR family transcriptional repressor of uid operon